MAGIILVITGLLLTGIGLVGRAGRLPRNHFVGIRLPSTMRSDDAWLAAHRASWPFTVVAGILMAILGLDMLMDPEQPPPEWVLLAVVLSPLLIAAVKAHMAARR